MILTDEILNIHPFQIKAIKVHPKPKKIGCHIFIKTKLWDIQIRESEKPCHILPNATTLHDIKMGEWYIVDS